MGLDGTWNIVVKSAMGDQEATAELKSSGTELTGNYTTMGLTMDVTEGVIDGSSAKWTVELAKPISIVSRFQVTVDGDTMSGEVAAGPFGTHQITGVRQ